MAKVTIVVEDAGESVDVSMEFAPAIDDVLEWDQLTKAQQIAHNFYEVLTAARPMTQESFQDELEPEQVALDLSQPREEDEFNGS